MAAAETIQPRPRMRPRPHPARKSRTPYPLRARSAKGRATNTASLVANTTTSPSAGEAAQPRTRPAMKASQGTITSTT